MSNILEIHNLHFTYPGTDLAVLKDLHLEIEKGDFVAIVGNNGCGKSTLCKAINGLIPHSITGRFTGEVIVNGKNTRTCYLGTIAKEAGYVYQDFENQIVRPTVLDDASYTCLNYGYENYLERGMQAIHRVNLDGKELEYVWELSGGQTHLLALAGALSLNPELLILDEPIAQLDPGNADTVYDVLKQLNEQEGKTILVIEHSTEYIAQYCNKVVFMKDGRVEWVLPTRDALQKADELLTSSIYPPQVTLATKALREEELLPTMEKLPITIHEAKETLRSLKLKAYHSETPPAKVTKELVRYDDIGLSYKAVKGEDKIVFDGLNLYMAYIPNLVILE